MGSASLDTAHDPLRPPGAVMVQRDGLPVVGHYGSVAAEIAVATKAAGLVDRSSLRLMTLAGPETLLEHVLGAVVPEGAPAAGHATCVAGTWCARTSPTRAVIAGGPGAVARWRQVASRSIAAAGLAVTAELLDAGAALSLVGPRAARIARAAGLPDELGVGSVGEGTLGGSPVTLIREDGDHLLLLFEQGHPAAVWQALWGAGHELGLAPVGNEALELLHAAHH